MNLQASQRQHMLHTQPDAVIRDIRVLDCPIPQVTLTWPHYTIILIIKTITILTTNTLTTQITIIIIVTIQQSTIHYYHNAIKLSIIHLIISVCLHSTIIIQQCICEQNYILVVRQNYMQY